MADMTSQDMAGKLLAAGFERSGPAATALSDPIADTPMVVTLDQLRPYDHDPRVTRNPAYAEIKASIRERGLDAPPAITRRPGEAHYIIRNGGNTRLAILRELRTLGIRISMDDFGTGYSSLSYLRRFPFDKIKIDQSFVRQTPDDKESAAIVRAIATLGMSLGLRTTAEGVETEAQSVFIVGEGCDQLQGYLISRPVPLEAITALFAVSSPRALTA